MGRHSKAYKPVLIRRQQEVDVELTPTPKSRRRDIAPQASTNLKGLPAKKATQKSKQTTIEDQLPNNSAPAHCLRNNKNARLSKFDLVKLVEKLAFAVSGLGDSQDIQAYLTKDELIDGETIRNLHKNCFTIKTALEELGNTTNIDHAQPASTSAHYGKYMVFRPKDKKLLYLLSVAEVFRPNDQAYSLRKTLGFIRTTGSTFPLMCALSGWKSVLDEHPRMLDSEDWLKEVKVWGASFGFVFKNTPWEKRHGREGGDDQATHCEPVLMLWWACYMTDKIFGPYASRREAIQNVWRLQKHQQELKAELVLSKAPCTQCLKFRDLIQEVTKIEFLVAEPMTNLAEVAPIKDANGYDIYPQLATQDVDADVDIKQAFDEFLDWMTSKPKLKDRISIEIPLPSTPQISKAKTAHSQLFRTSQSQIQPNSNNQGHSHSLAPENSIFYEEVTTTSKVQQKTIRDFSRFAYKNPNENVVFIASDDESEYEPPTPSKSVSRSSVEPYRTPLKPTSHWPRSPESMQPKNTDPFSPEALQLAKEMKKKRKREAAEAKEAAKKRGRWDGYL